MSKKTSAELAELNEAQLRLNEAVKAADEAAANAKRRQEDLTAAYESLSAKLKESSPDAAKLLAGKKMWRDPELMLDQWNKYETIAMHFNDLTMRFRVQALAALAAVSALAALASSAKGELLQYMWVFFAFLGVLWCAAWLLDAFYYSRMLGGAVEAILDFEKHTAPHIVMSTKIKSFAYRWRAWMHTFYWMILVSLFVVAFGAYHYLGAPAPMQPLTLPITFTVDGRSASAPSAVPPVARSAAGNVQNSTGGSSHATTGCGGALPCSSGAGGR